METDPNIDPPDKSHSEPAWFAVDWGTSNLRAWPIAKDGTPMQRLDSPKGMSSLQTDDYEQVLVDLLGDHLLDNSGGETAVLICGMAGSRSGWQDAGYMETPINAGALSGSAVSVETQDSRLNVRIMSGLKQLEPADVMRGEETQLAGFAASHPGFAGDICLPGTHSKWVSMQSGRIYNCRTAMTGELFDLLRNSSILRLSLTSEEEGLFPISDFLEGVEQGADDPNALTRCLFPIRAGDLLGDGRTAEGRLARLSGLLIGAEFSAMAPSSDSELAFVGSSRLATLYMRAARHLGFNAQAHDGETLVLAGLSRTYHTLFESTDHDEDLA